MTAWRRCFGGGAATNSRAAPIHPRRSSSPRRAGGATRTFIWRAEAQGHPQINQSISSAAVKRSNRSLNYLAPIRTTGTDGADDGSNGVKPLSSIPGSGAG